MSHQSKGNATITMVILIAALIGLLGYFFFLEQPAQTSAQPDLGPPAIINQSEPDKEIKPESKTAPDSESKSTSTKE